MSVKLDTKKSIPIEHGLSPWAIGFKRIKKNKMALLALAILSLLVLIAIFAPFITKYERDAVHPDSRYLPPSKDHLLGTDELGRDVLTRLIYGARASLSVGLVATSIAMIIGVVLGSISGYYGGWIDNVIMRLVDIIMCFPFFLMAIVIASMIGQSIYTVMVVTGLLSWPSLARIVRAEILSIKEREFVEAARALGLKTKHIIVSHILPNAIAVIIVYVTLGIAGGILSEAGLSYLGLGVKPPQPSWGNMLRSAESFRSLTKHPWLWVPPGILIFITVLSINIFGDGLRDALDPKLKR
ncbi:ABC transporter permease [Clostridium sp. 'deep sea']|uniref:oligopeptide ABC transporter permease n=1 Tax=Clostridium sp. 'deep sea' TaxID=2779445 RepID=UPI0018967B90|nr:oligopeptide ABC transporter permease [Clostridium sp. 'deep sea']QOR34057.1 ABC transporter permease [Clostridium sp. 'deep sea']